MGVRGGPEGATGRAELDRLVAAGAVVKLLLIPAGMGGVDEPGNVAWVPPHCAREKEAFDRRVQQQWGRGVPVEYAAVPAYDGESPVPSRLALSARGPGGNLHADIDVTRWLRPPPAARKPWWKFW